MPIDYGLDQLSPDELLGTAKAPAAPAVAPAPMPAPAAGTTPAVNAADVAVEPPSPSTLD